MMSEENSIKDGTHEKHVFESRRLFLIAGDWLKSSALIGGKLRLHFISKMAFKRGRRNQQRNESCVLSVKLICIVCAAN
jgi:hypothetical protein